MRSIRRIGVPGRSKSLAQRIDQIAADRIRAARRASRRTARRSAAGCWPASCSAAAAAARRPAAADGAPGSRRQPAVERRRSARACSIPRRPRSPPASARRGRAPVSPETGTSADPCELRQRRLQPVAQLRQRPPACRHAGPICWPPARSPGPPRRPGWRSSGPASPAAAARRAPAPPCRQSGSRAACRRPRASRAAPRSGRGGACRRCRPAGSARPPPCPFERDRVAGDARLGPGQQPLLAEQPVDQRRLADIGPPDDRELQRPLLGASSARSRRRPPSSRRPARREIAQPLVQLGQTLAVLAPRSAPARRGRAHRPRRGRRAAARPRPCWRPARPACRACAASRRNAGRRRSARRARRSTSSTTSASASARSVCARMRPASVSGARLLQPGGVDQRESRDRRCGLALAAVAGDARPVVDQREAPADQPVEQRRLADIGPPDDRNREGHAADKCPKWRRRCRPTWSFRPTPEPISAVGPGLRRDDDKSRRFDGAYR